MRSRSKSIGIPWIVTDVIALPAEFSNEAPKSVCSALAKGSKRRWSAPIGPPAIRGVNLNAELVEHAPAADSPMFGKHLISEHAITLIRSVKFQKLKARCNSTFAKHSQARFQSDNRLAPSESVLDIYTMHSRRLGPDARSSDAFTSVDLY